MTSGCANTFDPALYRAGAVPLTLADDCTVDTTIPDVTFTEASRAFLVDTRTLRNDMDQTLACLGRAAAGPEGFLRIRMEANERWHFHMRRTDMQDPALYILPTCDVRQCVEPQSIDICRQGADEHLTFEAPSTGTYLVAIDSPDGAGVSGMLQVIHPTCGNRTLEHSETCDDGNTVAMDGCDEHCRHEITSASNAELEVNDDSFSANHLLPTAGAIFATGRIATNCEADWFAIDVAAGQSLEVGLETSLQMPCPADRPANIDLEVIQPSGHTVVARGTAPTLGCPAVAPITLSTAGLYFIRVFARNDEIARPFDYGLRVALR